MKDRIVWVGRHEGLLRDVARGCAYGDPKSIDMGAAVLSAFIKPGSVLVPMPSHIGYATTMLDLCVRIVGLVKTSTILNCLKCIPHESSHIQKLRMGSPPEIHMSIKKRFLSEEGILPTRENMIIIDNTVCTGATASAALDAIPNATVLAITKG